MPGVLLSQPCAGGLLCSAPAHAPHSCIMPGELKCCSQIILLLSKLTGSTTAIWHFEKENHWVGWHKLFNYANCPVKVHKVDLISQVCFEAHRIS